MTQLLPLISFRLKLLGVRSIKRVALALQSGMIGLLFFAGLASVTYGCWMVYKPMGPMMGGVLAVSLALWLARK